MARVNKPVDVVVVGLGWAGSVMALELGRAGLRVVVLERGPMRDTAQDFNIAAAPDELRYAVRKDLMAPVARTAVTVRNTAAQTALPMRRWGSFWPGHGVGGAGLHWQGISYRFQPEEFRLRSHLVERYGAGALAPDLAVQDWGVDWREMEPHYAAFEAIVGVSGRAANIGATRRDGGNPFEGPRSGEYPTPPMRQTYGPTRFADAAAAMGYKPFPMPAATLSQAYTNLYGATMGPCTYCGFCVPYGCTNYSKSSPNIAVLPALKLNPNVEIRTNVAVTRVLSRADGKTVSGVRYVDDKGDAVDQPAEVVVVTAFALENVRLMLLSQIGAPYDPRTGAGVTGRNYSYQTPSRVALFFANERFNPFIAAGAGGMAIEELNNDNFDHGGLGFFGGASVFLAPPGAAPIGARPTPAGTPRWGAEWKEATAAHYLSSVAINVQGSSLTSRDNYLSLDPTYTDAYGDPLLRVTFDFTDNDRRMSRHCTSKAAEIGRAMGARRIEPHPVTGSWDSSVYQTTHVTGGFVMGTDPTTSAVNSALQSWSAPNLFVVGASAFPQNPGYNPTMTVGALALRAVVGVRDYLKSPGRSAQ